MDDSQTDLEEKSGVGGNISDGHCEPSDIVQISLDNSHNDLEKKSGGGRNITNGTKDPGTDTQQQSLHGQDGQGQDLQGQGWASQSPRQRWSRHWGVEVTLRIATKTWRGNLGWGKYH